MEKLLHQLQLIRPLSPCLLQLLRSILKYKDIIKGHYLQKEGDVSQMICFIEKGLMRSFRKNGNTVINNWFMTDGDVCIAVHSFYTGTPGDEYIQALSDTRVWYINRDELEEIYRVYPEFNYHGRILTEQYYMMSEEMIYPLRLRFKADRFKYFKEKFPRLVERVPMKYIASYLQTSESTLSRIKHATA